MRFSVIGFIIGAICAVILYIVGTWLLDFDGEGIVFGLLALLVWFLCTTQWHDRGTRAGL